MLGLEQMVDENIEEEAQKLLKKINETVIITLGSKGAYYFSKDGCNDYFPSIKVNAVDTTAAGDVFNGYLASYLADGTDLKTAIGFANKAAAISVTRKGAQPSIPYIDEL